MMKSSTLRWSLGSIQSSGLNLPSAWAPRGMKAAIWQVRSAASNSSIRRAPLSPFSSRDHVAGTLPPSGVTMPSPVMTTRRSPCMSARLPVLIVSTRRSRLHRPALGRPVITAYRRSHIWVSHISEHGYCHSEPGIEPTTGQHPCPQIPLHDTAARRHPANRPLGSIELTARPLECDARSAICERPPMHPQRPQASLSGRCLLQELHGIADRQDVLGGIIGDLAAEFFLERHDQFDGIKTVGAEIVDEAGVFRDLLGLDAQMLHHDLLHALCNVAHCLPRVPVLSGC